MGEANGVGCRRVGHFYHGAVKSLKVKESFLSIAGEGYHSGRPTVYVRLSGCNLWSGREEDRSSAVCSFCDTTFVGTDGQGGGDLSIDALLCRLQELWPGGGAPYVVFTGGEPALQLREEHVSACQERGWKVGIESNGTKDLPSNLDWVCISPKGGAGLRICRGHELKVVYPQEGLDLVTLECMDFDHHYLQPLWHPDGLHWKACAEHCLKHPRWSLSLQVHKLLGLP